MSCAKKQSVFGVLDVTLKRKPPDTRKGMLSVGNDPVCSAAQRRGPSSGGKQKSRRVRSYFGGRCGEKENRPARLSTRRARGEPEFLIAARARLEPWNAYRAGQSRNKFCGSLPGSGREAWCRGRARGPDSLVTAALRAAACRPRLNVGAALCSRKRRTERFFSLLTFFICV
jgi:hypothetical protein